MLNDTTVVRFHPTFRLVILLLLALSAKVLQLCLVPPAGVVEPLLRASLVVIGPTFFLVTLCFTVYTFTLRQEWTYNSVKFRRWTRTYEMDRDSIAGVTMYRTSLRWPRSMGYEFDSFELRGEVGGALQVLYFDFLMVGCASAKKTLNQWVLLRPDLVENSEILAFLSCRPGRLERS